MTGLNFLRSVLWWTRYLKLSSAIRYTWMLRFGGEGTIVVKTHSPFNADVSLRKQGSDKYTFSEIFVDEVYSCVVDSGSADTNCVVDLGANIGLASLYFLNAYPLAKIFAVEPNPSSFELLTKNLKSYCHSGRAEVLNAAAWHSRATLGGFCDKSAVHYSRFQVEEFKDENRELIDGLPMIDIIKYSGFEDIDLLKIDIEGAETALFAGDNKWLARVRTIAIEFHGTSREDIDFDSLVQKYGFNVVADSGHTVIATRSQSRHAQVP